jgi:hypothetical protein
MRSLTQVCPCDYTEHVSSRKDIGRRAARGEDSAVGAEPPPAKSPPLDPLSGCATARAVAPPPSEPTSAARGLQGGFGAPRFIPEQRPRSVRKGTPQRQPMMLVWSSDQA